MSSSSRAAPSSSTQIDDHRSSRPPERPFPQDPMQQLRDAVEAVFRSWMRRSCRRLSPIWKVSTDLVGTAVTVQAMVFGDAGVTSRSGVGFTRDSATGAEPPLLRLPAQRPGGRRRRRSSRCRAIPSLLVAAVPGCAHQLQTSAPHPRVASSAMRRTSSSPSRTASSGCCSSSPRSAPHWAALQIACDLVDEGLLDEDAALATIASLDLGKISPACDSNRLPLPIPSVVPLPASAGVAAGLVDSLDTDQALAVVQRGESVILAARSARPPTTSRRSRCVAGRSPPRVRAPHTPRSSLPARNGLPRQLHLAWHRSRLPCLDARSPPPPRR